MQNCPRCGSNRIHRAPLNGVLEHVRQRATKKRPYRCATCGWRGWAYPRHSRGRVMVAGQSIGPEPDLGEIDRELAGR